MWVLLKTDCVLFFASSYHLVWEKVEIKTHWVHCCLSFKTMCWAHVGRRTAFTSSHVHDGFIIAFACLLTAQRTVRFGNEKQLMAKDKGTDWNTSSVRRRSYKSYTHSKTSHNSRHWTNCLDLSNNSIDSLCCQLPTLWVMLFFAQKETQEIYCQIISNKMKMMTISLFTVTKLIVPYWIILLNHLITKLLHILTYNWIYTVHFNKKWYI